MTGSLIRTEGARARACPAKGPQLPPPGSKPPGEGTRARGGVRRRRLPTAAVAQSRRSGSSVAAVHLSLTRLRSLYWLPTGFERALDVTASFNIAFQLHRAPRFARLRSASVEDERRLRLGTRPTGIVAPRASSGPAVRLRYRLGQRLISRGSLQRPSVRFAAWTAAASPRHPVHAATAVPSAATVDYRVWEPGDDDWPMARQVVFLRAGTRVQIMSSTLETEALISFAATFVPAPTESSPPTG